MRGHKPTFHRVQDPKTGRDREHYVICQCRAYTERRPSRQEAEDLHLKHLRQIEQVRVHLRNKNPTLKSQRDYFLLMAEDTSQRPPVRDQWKMLADEITHRLGSTEQQDVALW